MKLSNIVLLGLFFIALLSCNNEDDDNKVNSPILNFTATYNSEPLVMLDKVYDYEDGMNLRLQLFQFFITDVRLIDESGEATSPFLDVALINFANNTNRAAATAGIEIQLKDVPFGKYTGIKFGVGVNPDLNKTKPENYTPGHPLTDHYWEAASSYVFSKIEGNADLEGNGDYSTKLTFHVGGNPRYREAVFTKDININVDGNTPIAFNIDLKDVLVNAAGDFVNFKEVTQIHNGTAETAVFIMDNLSSAITLK